MKERSYTTRELNEAAIRAFLMLEGGYEAYQSRGGRLTDLIPLLDAPSDDDLSGLRTIAARNGYIDPGRVNDRGEPVIEPSVARAWLLDTGRATEVDGKLILTSNEPDHIAISGLTIALGKDPQYLYDVYSNLPDHPVQLSREVVADTAKLILQTYPAPTDAR